MLQVLRIGLGTLVSLPWFVAIDIMCGTLRGIKGTQKVLSRRQCLLSAEAGPD